MQKSFFIFVIIFLINLSFSNVSYSVDPEEFLDNPDQELRARKISKKIRCLVCQNQSIDDSSALLAKDLRILIREKIKDGNSDKEIYEFLTDRYGDFILLDPSFKTNTFLLWVLPFVFLMFGLFIVFQHHQKSKKKNVRNSVVH